MIGERRPLGTLDPNATRVQPRRAAKTGHKWLSHRRSKSGEDNNMNCNQDYSQSKCSIYTNQHLLLQKSHTDNELNTNENNINNQIMCNSNVVTNFKTHLPKPIECADRMPECDNYKHTTCLNKNLCLRIPLQTLENHNIATEVSETIIDTTHHHKYFVAIHKNNESALSSSLDAESDVSYRSISEDELSSDYFLSRSQSSKKSNHRRLCESDAYLDSVKPKHPDFEVLEEYLCEVLSYMKLSEQKYQPKKNYLKKQSEITSPMRIKLIDWLVEVQGEYKLYNETLYLAVAYVDRFLSEMSVTRAKLQLLGTTSMFLAAKFEEIYPPDADEFAYVTADTYTRSEVLCMERMIMKVFKCTLAIPTAYQYLTLFHEKSNLDDVTRYLSCYLSELMLLDENYLAYTPSVKAASAVSLALCTVRHAHQCDLANGNLSSQSNSEDMSLETEGSEETKPKFARIVMSSSIQSVMAKDVNEIFKCTLELAESHVRESNLNHFVREKYLSSSQKRVAKIIPALDDTHSRLPCPLSWTKVTELWLT